MRDRREWHESPEEQGRLADDVQAVWLFLELRGLRLLRYLPQMSYSESGFRQRNRLSVLALRLLFSLVWLYKQGLTGYSKRLTPFRRCLLYHTQRNNAGWTYTLY